VYLELWPISDALRLCEVAKKIGVEGGFFWGFAKTAVEQKCDRSENFVQL
jgi:hypothetical protein